MPIAFDESQFIAAWRFIIAQQPKVFTWDGDDYTGFVGDIAGTIDLGFGGFTQTADARLYCLREDFPIEIPAEGEQVIIGGNPYRIVERTIVKTFGLVFGLKGPSQP